MSGTKTLRHYLVVYNQLRELTESINVNGVCIFNIGNTKNNTCNHETYKRSREFGFIGIDLGVEKT